MVKAGEDIVKRYHEALSNVLALPGVPELSGERRRYQDSLQQERETLLDEERRAPHDKEALAVWSLADIISGRHAWRDTRLREIDRDLSLSRYGYKLVQLPPAKDDPSWRILHLFTIGMTRLATRITRDYLKHCSITPDLLDGLAENQHHMACRLCGEPVLRHLEYTRPVEYINHTLHPSWVWKEGHLEMGPPDPRLEWAGAIEYRSVEAGPHSEPITMCQHCEQRFNPYIVVEIEPHRYSRGRDKTGA